MAEPRPTTPDQPRPAVPQGSPDWYAGRSVIVTGAGTGLGAAVAVAFARRGCALTLVGRRREMLEATRDLVVDAGGAADVVPGDVAHEQTAIDAVARAVDAFGGVDVLVNNAGLHAHPQRLHETPAADFDEFIAVDLRGPFLFTKAAVPSMISRGGGAVLNVSSMCGLVGFKYSTPYTVAKAGLNALTKATAVDYAEFGIRANAICPGGMEPVERSNVAAGDYALLHEAVASAGGPLIRGSCHVSDMAELVVFLCGPHVPTMTGAVIPVDGGFTAH